MNESIGRRDRPPHLLDQPRYHHLEPPGRRPYPNCSVGRRRHMSGGRHSTTNRRRRQCSQSSLSLLAPYRVDLPCHWCGGCLAAGAGLVVADLLTRPRVPCCCPKTQKKIRCRSSRLLASGALAPAESWESPRNAPRRGQKRAAHHMISMICIICMICMLANECVGGRYQRCCLDERHGADGVSAYLIAASRRATDRLTCAWMAST